MKIVKLRYFLGFVLIAILCSCQEEKDFDHTTTLTPFEYVTENGLSYELKGTPEDTIRFEWTKSKASNETLVFYEIQFVAEDGDFEHPAYTDKTRELGTVNYYLITDSVLNVVAERAGIKQETTGKIYWRVVASNGIVQFTLDQDQEFTVNRPFGFAEYPSKLYMTGSAVGDGSDMTTLIAGKRSLNDTLIFNFVGDLSHGDLKFATDVKPDSRFFGVDAGTIAEGFATEVSEEGLYRISLDFRNVTAEFRQITSVEQIFVKSGSEDAVLTELIYGGGLIWTKEFDAFLPDDSPIPNGGQYKFRFTESEPGSESVYFSYWGKTTAAAAPPNQTTTPDYFEVVRVGGENPPLNYYRFPLGIGGGRLKTVLDFSGDQDVFSHSCTLVE